MQSCPAAASFDKSLRRAKPAGTWLMTKLKSDPFLYARHGNIFLDAAEMKRKVLIWSKSEKYLKDKCQAEQAAN